MEPILLALLIFLGILSGMGYCCWAWYHSQSSINEENKEEVHNNFLTFGTTGEEDYSQV